MPPPLPGHQLKAFDIFPKIGKKLSMQMQRAGSFHKVQQRKLPPRRRWGWEGVRGGGFRYISLFFLCCVLLCVPSVFIPFFGPKKVFQWIENWGENGDFRGFFFCVFRIFSFSPFLLLILLPSVRACLCQVRPPPASRWRRRRRRRRSRSTLKANRFFLFLFF